jgi:hypothetical protein
MFRTYISHSGFPTNILYTFLISISQVPYTPSIHPVPHNLIHQPEQYLKNTNYKAPITQFYPATQHFISFR